MTWRPWRTDQPAELRGYVQRKRVSELLRIPGPSARAVAPRAREIFDELASKDVRYAFEPTTSGPGRQVIRSADQVLRFPKHATCLDLALIYSAACLEAGLHPLVALVDAPGGGRHAVVLLWNESSEWPLDRTVVTPDRVVFGELGVRRAIGVEATGSLLAVDVSLLASGYLPSEMDRSFDHASPADTHMPVPKRRLSPLATSARRGAWRRNSEPNPGPNNSIRCAHRTTHRIRPCTTRPDSRVLSMRWFRSSRAISSP